MTLVCKPLRLGDVVKLKRSDRQMRWNASSPRSPNWKEISNVPARHPIKPGTWYPLGSSRRLVSTPIRIQGRIQHPAFRFRAAHRLRGTAQGASANHGTAATGSSSSVSTNQAGGGVGSAGRGKLRLPSGSPTLCLVLVDNLRVRIFLHGRVSLVIQLRGPYVERRRGRVGEHGGAHSGGA